jgi:hypothetical protein
MDDAAEREEGGESVCWAHLVCPDCGAISSEGHRAGCQLAEQALGQAGPDDEAWPPSGRSRSSDRRRRVDRPASDGGQYGLKRAGH